MVSAEIADNQEICVLQCGFLARGGNLQPTVLEIRLGYTFQEPALLQQALTHPSFRSETNNQRLEFLGDAVVQLVVTELLYHQFPHKSEGELTPLRARLVNRGSLALLAERLQIGPLLHLGSGEKSDAGRQRPSNLADALEAIIGAIYVDAAWATAREVTRRLFVEDFAALENETGGVSTNPKGDLQELLQRQGGEAPEYECLQESGYAHDRFYEVKVSWRGQELGRGPGKSKRAAEVRAALEALKFLTTKEQAQALLKS
jgi:ribonuclease III